MPSIFLCEPNYRVVDPYHLYGQSNCTKGVYSCSSESNKWRISWNQLFSLNPHLLERRVVKDIDGAPIAYKDLMSVVVPPSYKWWRCRASSFVNPITGLSIRTIFRMKPVNWML